MSDKVKRLNVGEVITLLQNYNPNDELMIITTSRYIGYITGLDHELMAKKPYIILRIDYDNVIREVEELQEDIDSQIAELEKLKANIDTHKTMLAMEKKNKGLRTVYVEEQEKLTKQQQRAKDKEERENARQQRRDETGSPNRSVVEQILAGFLPASGRGRPRKFLNPSKSLKDLMKADILNGMSDEELTNFVMLLKEDYDNKRKRGRLKK